MINEDLRESLQCIYDDLNDKLEQIEDINYKIEELEEAKLNLDL